MPMSHRLWLIIPSWVMTHYTLSHTVLQILVQLYLGFVYKLLPWKIILSNLLLLRKRAYSSLCTKLWLTTMTHSEWNLLPIMDTFSLQSHMQWSSIFGSLPKVGHQLRNDYAMIWFISQWWAQEKSTTSLIHNYITKIQITFSTVTRWELSNEPLGLPLWHLFEIRVCLWHISQTY